MTIGLLKDIATQIPKNTRLLGIDVGTKTLGLAVCDPDHKIATPLKTILRTKFTKDIKELEIIVREYEIGGFVIGLPLNMDGSEGRRCQSVRDFAAEMEKALTPTLSHREREGPAKREGEGVWIALWDERLSTAAVEDFVDNSVGINRRKAKESGLTDKLAAQHILQGALGFILT